MLTVTSLPTIFTITHDCSVMSSHYYLYFKKGISIYLPRHIGLGEYGCNTRTSKAYLVGGNQGDVKTLPKPGRNLYGCYHSEKEKRFKFLAKYLS